MAELITREVGASAKGSPLTNAELDQNFINLNTDPRLSDSREWTASTVTQAEAEAGTATTRRAWTSQRVRQAINAVVGAIGNATTTVKGWMSPEDKTKLNGIATGATKNATDAQLRDRATHTGTQAISTVSGLQTALDGKSATGHTHALSNISDAGNLAALSTTGSTANYLRGDGAWVKPPNTTYSVISTAEIDAGTATTSRVISAVRIKYILDKKADASHGHTVSDISGLSDAATTSVATIRSGTTKANVGLGNVQNVDQTNASNLSSGTVPNARISGSYTGLASLTGSGNVDFARFLGNASDTVTAPSYSWTGDANTGIYRPAADQVAITTGGVQRALFSSAGISGVGTGLTALDGSNISTGTVADARLPSTVVRTSRKVNGKALSANISLTAADVGAAASSHNHSAANITSGTLAGARLPNATASVQGAVKVRLNGTTAYITTNGDNA